MNEAAVGELSHHDRDPPERMCHTIFRELLLTCRTESWVERDPVRERHKGPGKTRPG